MGKRLAVSVLLVALLVAVSLPGAVQAAGYGCAKGGHGYKKGKHKGFEMEIFHKAHFILKNQEELGLSEEQVERIKGLKIEVKKELIKRRAEIEILAVDIKAKMHEGEIDIKAVNKLIDKKYELKKEKAKYLIKTYVELKSILTEEQKQSLKAIWRICAKGQGPKAGE